MTVSVRPVAPGDLQTFVEIRNSVTPERPTSIADVAWSDAAYPGGCRLLGDVDGTPVGAGNAGRIYVQPPDSPWWWAEITVLPEWRRRGVGTALLGALSQQARRVGKTGLQVPVSADRPAGIDFLEHRGFAEHERSKAVRLDLGGAPAEAPAPPAGVRLTTLRERPDLVAGVHRLAVEAFADIPGGEPIAVGDLAEFRARDVDRPGMAPDAFFVAVAGDEVVGYASLLVETARPAIGLHDMTAVARAWRGRGIATALKIATIGWAARAGLEALETVNDVENVAMRATNDRLGYRPLPDLMLYRGPLAVSGDGQG